MAAEIRALKRMKDSEIDTSDIPPKLDWSEAIVGKLERRVQKPVSIRLDPDVLAWLKVQGEDHETRINALLRSSMEKADSEKFVIRVSDYGEFTA